MHNNRTGGAVLLKIMVKHNEDAVTASHYRNMMKYFISYPTVILLGQILE